MGEAFLGAGFRRDINTIAWSTIVSKPTITLTGDITGSGGDPYSIATTLKNSGVTAGSYGQSAAATLSPTGTFKVPYITVDAKGRVTAASTKTITLASDIMTQTTSDNRYLKLAGGTLTGRVSTSLAPTATTHLTNKSYVDSAIAAILSVGTTAPTAAGVLLWIDTNTSTGGLKYKNSSGSWVQVPVAYAD